MVRFIVDMETSLQLHSFRTFLVGAAVLVLIRVLAGFLDRPLRSRTGAGYASDAQLVTFGLGAVAASLALQVWLHHVFVQGLFAVVAVVAVAGVLLHRTVHRAALVSLGSVFQAVFAAAAYLVAAPIFPWFLGLSVALVLLTLLAGQSARARIKRETARRRRKERDHWDREREAEANRWWREDEERRRAMQAEPQVGEWPF